MNTMKLDLHNLSLSKIWGITVLTVTLLSSSSCLYIAGSEEGSDSDSNNNDSDTIIPLSWTSLDQYTLSTSKNARASAVAFSSSGSVAAAGKAEHATTNYHWIIRERASGQSTVSTVDDYQLSAGKNAAALAIAYTSTNLIVAAGYALDANLSSHWIVRVQQVGGAFTTSDDYQLSVGAPAQAKSIAILANGDIAVAGTATHATGNQRWIVRLYSGGSWSTIDTYVHTASEDSLAEKIVYDSVTGDLVTVGQASDGTDSHWIVRRYTVGAWSTIDDYQFQNNKNAYALTALFTDSGDLYVAGNSLDSSDVAQWVVRRQDSSTPAGALSTVDEFEYSAGENSFADGLAYSSSDDTLYVVGHAINSSSGTTWIVRSSSDEGTSFQTIVDTESVSEDYSALDVALGPNNEVAVGGMINDTYSQWLVQILE